MGPICTSGSLLIPYLPVSGEQTVSDTNLLGFGTGDGRSEGPRGPDGQIRSVRVTPSPPVWVGGRWTGTGTDGRTRGSPELSDPRASSVVAIGVWGLPGESM